MEYDILRCNRCGHEERGGTGILMDRIKMWNHLKREHPLLAERIMRSHDVMPAGLYSRLSATPHTSMRDIRPRWV